MKIGPLDIKVNPEVPSDEVWFMDGDELVGKITGIGGTPTPSPRRLENRVATLEDSLFKLSEDHNALLRHVIELQEKVQALTDEMGNINTRLNALTMDPTPDQPAAPRIDPSDEGQVGMVARMVAKESGTDDVMDCYGAAHDILTALAKHLNGPTDE